MRGEPAQPADHGLPGPRAAFGFMQRLAVVVDGDAHFQPVAMGFLQRQQVVSAFFHGPHRIGEYQCAMAALQAVGQHCHEVWVHEGLAASEADFLGAEVFARDLVEIVRHLAVIDVDQAVIGGRGLDVAVGARQIAQRPRVDPQRLQTAWIHAGACRAVGGALRVGKLGGWRGGIHGRDPWGRPVRRRPRRDSSEALCLRPGAQDAMSVRVEMHRDRLSCQYAPHAAAVAPARWRCAWT